MSEKKIKFSIATPEKVVYEADIDVLTCNTEMGEVTILPGHIPLVANLTAGELRTEANDEMRYIAVMGGFLEVRLNNQVVILADAAEHDEEIDLERAEAARKRAEKLMKEEILDDIGFAEATAALERAMARLRVGRKKRYKDVGKQPFREN